MSEHTEIQIVPIFGVTTSIINVMSLKLKLIYICLNIPKEIQIVPILGETTSTLNVKSLKLKLKYLSEHTQ